MKFWRVSKPTVDSHQRLRLSSAALLKGVKDYYSGARRDSNNWHNLQRAEMAVRHALEDEELGAVCPCTACRDIGGVDPHIHEAFNIKVFGNKEGRVVIHK